MLLELASDGLKGRVFEVSLADLQNDEQSFRKFRLISEDVQGKNVLTNFHGMTMTTDKLRSLVKKWQVRRAVVVGSFRSYQDYISSIICAALWGAPCLAGLKQIRSITQTQVFLMNIWTCKCGALAPPLSP